MNIQFYSPFSADLSCSCLSPACLPAAALKLVADAFPWSPGSAFLHLTDNHTSVLGMREVALQRGAGAVGAVSARGVAIGSGAAVAAAAQPAAAEPHSSAASPPPHHLFAFPLESNFSGVRYDEGLSTAVQEGAVAVAPGALSWYVGGGGEEGSGSACGNDASRLPPGSWKVLLDAAKACGTRPPDLSRHRPDFVALSYYKIFGCPTGLGALLVRRDAVPLLKKAYFGGGTVAAVVAEARFHAARPGAAALEDGTLPFLSIPAAVQGFSWLAAAGGFGGAEAAAGAAAARLAASLRALRHVNGAPLCAVYGAWGEKSGSGIGSGQGPVVAFNVLRSDGGWVGHRQVERMAGLEGVMLRTGGMCNPGALREALGAEVEGGRECCERKCECLFRPQLPKNTVLTLFLLS